ncbi:MAG: BMP family ABC transporter substrate-binding protein [Nitrososphaerota archaeon]
MKGKISRRKFLGVSTSTAAGAVAAAAVVAGIGGYFGGQATAPAREVVRTETVTQTKTETVSAPRRIKVGYIYVGPVGDFGWTYAHDQGRKWADRNFGAADSTYIESVPEAESAGAIETLVNQGADLVITTSFGFMDATAEIAAKHQDRYFVHISGYKSGVAPDPQFRTTPNMSAAFAEFYQLYYLNGLAAGAVTQTGVVGYVAAHPIPEVIRHINAFVLGANYSYKKRTGKNIKAFVNWLFSWFDPGKTRVAATALVEESNADVIAFTEDSPTTLQVAQEYTSKGRRVWSFSHYGDMRQYGPDAHLTGQIVHWGPIYNEFYRMVATKTWQPVDIWTRIGDYMPYKWRLPVEKSTMGNVDGTLQMAPLAPQVPSEWQAEIKKRYEEMKELLFEPFSVEGNLGEPIRDQSGQVRYKEGERADHDALWTMDWFVEYIESELPKV